MKEIKRRSTCPISYTLDIIGDKWSLLILRDILLYNRTRYSDFAPHEKIATNILASRLEKLENFGIIAKKADPDHGKQFVYSATKKGRSMLPIILELMLWGFEFDSNSPISDKFMDRVKQDKQAVVAEIETSIENKSFFRYRAEEMSIVA